jgi:hypothetical protein
MTVYNYVDILESIPPEVWKDLPTWHTAFYSRHKRTLCKNKKSLEHMQKLVDTFHFPSLSTGDQLQFDVWKHKVFSRNHNVQTATFTKGKSDDKACNVSSVLVKPGCGSMINVNGSTYWQTISWCLWDFVRKNKIAEYKASILTEEQLLHIAVQQTESTLVIASKVNKIEAEVQALKQKIAAGTLSLEDTKNFYHQVYENLLEVNRNNKNLPK